MRPKSIQLFERLFLSNTLVSILAVLLNYGALRADAVSRGEAAAGPLIGIAMTLIIDLPLWYFIARRASRVAKWLLVVLYVLGILGLIPMWSRIEVLGVSYGAMIALSAILATAAMGMLFRRDAREWFARRGGRSPTDPSIFE